MLRSVALLLSLCLCSATEPGEALPAFRLQRATAHRTGADVGQFRQMQLADVAPRNGLTDTQDQHLSPDSSKSPKFTQLSEQDASNSTSEGVDHCSKEAEAEKEEAEKRHLAIIMVVAFSMLGLLVVFCVGFVLESYHIIWIPEAGIGIAVGLLISVIAKLCLTEHVATLLRFNPELFFIFLLPPIMFEAGYNMQRKAFFCNIGAICSYAFLGTTISCFAVGGIMYYAGQWGWCRPIGGLAALVFGAIISATDPVTTLAVFKQLKADVHLYSLVFGESALNDAVAIVLYRTLIEFNCGWSLADIGTAVGTFLAIFIMSTTIGMCVAGLSALLLKYCRMRDHPDFLFGELSVLCCFPYLAFTLSEGVGFSGLVAILFCGVGMAHYTANNVSQQASEISRHFFSLLAKLSETFVFIYLGEAVFSFKMNFEQFQFVGMAFAACLVARALNVYPISLVINMFRPKAERISQRCQFVIWFGGLRGAVAFLIAVQSWGKKDFPRVSEPEFPGFTDSDCILNATLLIAILSVFTMGGPVGPVMKCFNLTSNLEEEVEEADGPTKPPAIGSYLYVD
eukprot:EG_transcript_8160